MHSLKWIVLPLYLMSSVLQAQFDTTVVRNFKGNYSDPSGSATAVTWNVSTTTLSNAQFNIQREESQMRLTYGTNEHIIENIPLDLITSSQANVSGVYLSAANNRADFSFYKLSGKISGNIFTSQNLKMSCSKKSGYSDELDKYLDACTTNSFINFEKINLNTNKLANIIVKAVTPFLGETRSSTLIQNIKLNVVNKKLTFSLKAAGFNIKGEGSLEYKKINGKRQVRVRIDKVRSGFFTVTSTVFNALGKISSPKVKVQRPYITISF